jgi:hypothetical protein
MEIPPDLRFPAPAPMQQFGKPQRNQGQWPQIPYTPDPDDSEIIQKQKYACANQQQSHRRQTRIRFPRVRRIRRHKSDSSLKYNDGWRGSPGEIGECRLHTGEQP